MKRTTTHTKTKILGGAQADSFKIANNKEMFDALREGLYKNPIGAIAREISSNARDANRENGNEDKPIEIEIRDTTNKMFSASNDLQIIFRDYGPGITEDRIKNIFLYYGKSTKTTTNHQTGGFGLGAKTPFAYTEQFTVITTVDNKGKRLKYIWTASVNDSKGVGSGEMVQFSCEETTDATGTQVIIPVKHEDREQFEHEVHKSTAFWKTQPRLIGFTTDKWEFDRLFVNEGKNKFIVVNDPTQRLSRTGYTLILDGIVYDLDINLMKFPTTPMETSAYNSSFVLCFEFKTGDLTIAVNREAVRYDEKTKTAITKRFQAAKDALRVYIQKYIAKRSKNYLTACITADKLTRSKLISNAEDEFKKSIYAWLEHERVGVTRYKGQSIQKKFNFKYHSITWNPKPLEDQRPEQHDMSEGYVSDQWLKPMFWQDESRRSTARNATLWDKHGGFILIKEKTIKKKTSDHEDAKMRRAQNKGYRDAYKQAIADQKKERDLINSFGVKIGKYSEVKKKKNVAKYKTTYHKRTNEVKVKARVASNEGHRIYVGAWRSTTLTFLRKEKTSIDPNQKYIYHIVDKLTGYNEYNSIPVNNAPTSTQIAKAKIAGLVGGAQVIVVGKKASQHVVDASNTMTFDEAWSKVKNKRKVKTIVQRIVDARFATQIALPNMYNELNFANPPKQYETLVNTDDLEDIDNDQDLTYGSAIARLVPDDFAKEHFGVVVSKQVEKCKDVKNALDKRYPLLKHLEKEYVRLKFATEERKQIISDAQDYVNLIDNCDGKSS